MVKGGQKSFARERENERAKGKKEIKSVDAKLSAITSLGMNVYIYIQILIYPLNWYYSCLV